MYLIHQPSESENPDAMEEDKKMIEQILAGQTGLFRQVIVKYQATVYRVALKISGNEDDAREITQQVFVTVYESLNQYNPDYKFFSWLYRIAVNRALLSVRQKKQFLPIDQYRLNAGDEEDRPKAKEMRDALLNQSIGKLKEKYRTVIVLKYYAGMPYADIAETLEITEKKVRSRLFDARKQLKDELIRIHFFTQWND